MTLVQLLKQKKKFILADTKEEVKAEPIGEKVKTIDFISVAHLWPKHEIAKNLAKEEHNGADAFYLMRATKTNKTNNCGTIYKLVIQYYKLK